MRIYLSAQIKTLGRAFPCPCRRPPFDTPTFLRRGREKNISCRHFAQLVEIVTSQKFSKVRKPQKSAARVSPPRARKMCRGAGQKFSKPSSLHNVLYRISIELAFENFGEGGMFVAASRTNSRICHDKKADSPALRTHARTHSEPSVYYGVATISRLL